MTSIAQDHRTEPPPAPWWRFPIVWFALAGPALVVVAGFATMAIAFAHADRVLPEVPAATTPAGRPQPTSPALQARNHAATPPQREAP